MIIRFPSTDYSVIAYPGGELQVRLTEATLGTVRASEEVAILATVQSAEDAVKLVLLGDAVRWAMEAAVKVPRVSLEIPYLPYARGDRRFVAGDCAGLDVFGRILSAGKFDSVKALDVHNERAAENAVTGFSNVYPVGLILKTLLDFDQRTGGKTAILFPDAGALARYGHMGLSFQDSIPSRGVFTATKKRDQASGALSGFDVPAIPEEMPVLLVDDLCDGGGTFVGIADALKRSPDKLGLYVTHSIFSKGLDVLRRRFGHIYTTDSFPLSFLKTDASVTSYSAYDYMADWELLTKGEKRR